MRSKRFIELQSKIDKETFEINNAIDKIKETANAKFDESVEISIKLGIDPSKSDQTVRGSVGMPHGTGKEVAVAVVTQNEKEAEESLKAGAVLAGKDNVIEQIKSGNINFDILISSPDCMKDLGKFGKVLGPKGLMPSPKAGTVTKDILDALEKVKKGQVEFKMDKNAVINGIIGKASFEAEKLIENFNFYVETVTRARPSSAKGKFITKISLSSTMGPSVNIVI